MVGWYLYCLLFLCNQKIILKFCNLYRKRVIFIKLISKKELSILFENNILKNTKNGFVTVKDNRTVGHYRTKGVAKKMYLEDYYVLKARKLLKGGYQVNNESYRYL